METFYVPVITDPTNDAKLMMLNKTANLVQQNESGIE